MKLYLVIGALMAALSGALWLAIERNIDANAQLSAANTNLDRTKAERDDQGRKLKGIIEERDRLTYRLSRIKREQDRLQGALADERAARSELEQTNEEYRNWANADIPATAIRLLQQSPLHHADTVPAMPERDAPGLGGAPPQPQQPAPEP